MPKYYSFFVTNKTAAFEKHPGTRRVSSFSTSCVVTNRRGACRRLYIITSADRTVPGRFYTYDTLFQLQSICSLPCLQKQVVNKRKTKPDTTLILSKQIVSFYDLQYCTCLLHLNHPQLLGRIFIHVL